MQCYQFYLYVSQYCLLLLSNWKCCHINLDLLLSNCWFLRNLVSVTVAREPLYIIIQKIYLI